MAIANPSNRPQAPNCMKKSKKIIPNIMPPTPRIRISTMNASSRRQKPANEEPSGDVEFDSDVTLTLDMPIPLYEHLLAHYITERCNDDCITRTCCICS